jgi:hypothetical protein
MGRMFELVEDKNWMEANDAIRTQIFQSSLLKITGKNMKNSTIDTKSYASEVPH